MQALFPKDLLFYILVLFIFRIYFFFFGGGGGHGGMFRFKISAAIVELHYVCSISSCTEEAS